MNRICMKLLPKMGLWPRNTQLILGVIRITIRIQVARRFAVSDFVVKKLCLLGCQIQVQGQQPYYVYYPE